MFPMVSLDSRKERLIKTRGKNFFLENFRFPERVPQRQLRTSKCSKYKSCTKFHKYSFLTFSKRDNFSLRHTVFDIEATTFKTVPSPPPLPSHYGAPLRRQDN